MRLLGDLRRHVVADVVVQRGHEHQRVLEVVADGGEVWLHAVDTLRPEGAAGVREQARAVQEVVDHHRLVHVELEVALAATDGDGRVVAHDLTADHRHRFGLRRVDLSRHDGGAGFVGRQREFPKATAGSRTEPADVVGDLHQRSGEGVEGSRSGNDGVVGRQLGELVRRGNEGQAGRFGDGRGHPLGEVWMRVQAGAHGGAAERQLVQVLDREGEAAQVRVQLGHPAAGFLTEGERYGVHEVGPADLDDARPGLGLGRQRIAQGSDGRNDLVDDGFGPGDVHRGGEGVVGGLRPVDVVVGVHGRLAAEHAAGHLDGAVGDDLVGVHVGLCARSCLPNAQREVVVELAVDDLLSCGGDQITDRGVQLA